LVLLTMFRHIREVLRNIYHTVQCRNVYLGRDLRSVPPDSIIVFPTMADTLLCGLAGILVFKRGDVAQTEDITKGLSGCLDRIEDCGMEALLDESVPTNEYLGGPDIQEILANNVNVLKQDAIFEHIFFMKKGVEKLSSLSKRMNSFLGRQEILLEENITGFSTGDIEQINETLNFMRDTAWALERDILSNVDRIMFLSGSDKREGIMRGNFRKYININLLLNAIDRLEVRGRDSAGIQIMATLNGRQALNEMKEGLIKSNLYDDWIKRLNPGDLHDGSIQLSGETGENGRTTIIFTYKKASVTGELGENTRFIRERIRSDRILRASIDRAAESDIYLAHTRWASVGSITEENCHPINNFTVDTELDTSSELLLPVKEYPHYGRGNWSINVALNGDIDNYNVLRSTIETGGRASIDKSVTTDTKIIPLQIEKYLYKGCDLPEAFRLALNDFEGSHAIAMQSNLEPDKIFLALRGSGQSLYVGLCHDKFIFSSELYGLVEMTPRFVKMDGENERIPGNPRTRGQIVILTRGQGDSSRGIDAWYYDGHHFHISEDMVQTAEITTRDIDRKDYPHYLLKEIFEAPLSARKTLRGKYRITRVQDDTVHVDFNLGYDIVPLRVVQALRNGTIRNVFIIGQGTAAVAGAAIADAFSQYLQGADITITAKTASELSGFSLADNLDHALIIPVTQSGTTTDTNRAVAMAKERGAHLIAIVNRRQSDITHVSDGVFYTSDGRDIEMSVASTKAFYSQIVAGYILALYFAQIRGTMSEDHIVRELTDLEDAPDKMNSVISARDHIKESAWDIVKKKIYWAVVGSGPNKVAADEIRIKLSELCYKTISSDIVEDKKHIDLSSEPLIITCAAGNPEPVVEDIVKDVAIFKAHSAATVVITDEGETRFSNIADSTIFVPRSSYPTSIILNTLAGHIWGYYAACSINEDGEFFRTFRNKLSLKVRELDKRNESVFEQIANADLHKIMEEFSSAFRFRKDQGFFSSLRVGLASDITLLLKYAVGKLPLEDFWEEFQEKRISSSPLDMLDISLGHAIDELSRPIDAIRHQAKTVTVGTSRKGEMLAGILFGFMRELEFSLENLTSKDGSAVRRLQNAISGINGYTLYRIDNLGSNGKPVDTTTIKIGTRSGVSLAMKSRVEKPGPVKGTKRTIISTGEIYAGLGKTDKAPIVIIPLLGDGHVIRHILLIHVDFKKDLTPSEKKEVLGDKFNKINNLVDEYNLPWDDNYLERLSIEFLLGEGVDVIVGNIIKSLKDNQSNNT
jgi:glucosamine--fructose-6-phosphate aminotransferase (isomerizing)